MGISTHMMEGGGGGGEISRLLGNLLGRGRDRVEE